MKRSVALAAFLALFVVAPTSSMAQDESPRIEVTGLGENDVAPDMAVITLSVTREEKTARAALDTNNEAMAAVLEAMREAGVEDRDLQTSGFSINPRIVYPGKDDRDEAPTIVGYSVSNSLTVRIRDLQLLGAILDRAVTLGVNQGGQIVFANSDPSAALTVARRRAVEDAIDRATTIAEAAGGSLGAIVKITEQSHSPHPLPVARAEMAMRASDSVPVATGENAYRVLVNVTFEYRP